MNANRGAAISLRRTTEIDFDSILAKHHGVVSAYLVQLSIEVEIGAVSAGIDDDPRQRILGRRKFPELTTV